MTIFPDFFTTLKLREGLVLVPDADFKRKNCNEWPTKKNLKEIIKQ